MQYIKTYYQNRQLGREFGTASVKLAPQFYTDIQVHCAIGIIELDGCDRQQEAHKDMTIWPKKPRRAGQLPTTSNFLSLRK